MPWIKTDAGRLEIQSRSAVNGRAQRNLLLLIDGKKSDEQLLSQVAGTSAADFDLLRDLGFIAPAGGAAPDPTRSSPQSAQPATAPASQAPHTLPPSIVEVDIPVDVNGLPNFGHVSKTLTGLIASELGLRGFTLTLAVERAAGLEALLEVADRVISQIETRRGASAAERARRAIFG